MDGVEMFKYIRRFVLHTQMSKQWKQKLTIITITDLLTTDPQSTSRP